MSEDDPDVAEANARIEAMYALLRSEYRLSLPEKIEALKSVLDGLEAQGNDSALFDNALMQLHRTKGTIGSYGFTELARMVEAIETLMKQAHRPPNQHVGNEEIWQSIRKQVEEIFVLAKQEATKLTSDTAGDAIQPAQ